MFPDTCNVYVVRDGDSCLLVDTGSGAALERLSSIGVSHIEWVLHTHHHRDQCQGDQLLPKETKIAVPFHERALFEDAENFWRNKQIYDSYNDQSTYFTSIANTRVDDVLRDYETFQWQNQGFKVLPAMGHTHGSVVLLSRIEERVVAFTGDLIHSPGKVLSLTELQHSYGGPEGVDLNAYSLRDLSFERPDLLLPSHGQPMDDPEAAIPQTIENLRRYHRHLSGQPLTIDKAFKQLLPHLLIASHACCTCYVLLSESGKALLIDYGAASFNHFYAHLRQFESWEVQRFVEHSIRDLKEVWGVKSIDVVIPTHYHDDHTCGIPHIQKHHGVKLWALDRMVNILENPGEYNAPCLLPYPMKVDRPIPDGESVAWEEYTLKVVHFPGQTEYHMAMAVDVDGKRVVFTGDSVQDAGPRLAQPVIHRNVVTAESHEKCARVLAELRPDVLAHGHGGWFEVNEEKVKTLSERARQTRELFETLLPEPSAIGVNPAWTRLVPYQSSAQLGGVVPMEIEVHNYFGRAIKVACAIAVPEGWLATPSLAEMTIPEDGTKRLSFEVRVGGESGRFAIAADLAVDGKRLGQVTEAIVEVGRWQPYQ